MEGGRHVGVEVGATRVVCSLAESGVTGGTLKTRDLKTRDLKSMENL